MEQRQPQPPELGTLLGVIPILQKLRRGEWMVSLNWIERWDNCFVATFDVERDGLVTDIDDWLHPSLVLQATDDRGRRYDDWFGGGYGRGRTIWCRLVHKLTPALDRDPKLLHLDVDLFVFRNGERMTPLPASERGERAPWSFTVELSPDR